MAVTRSGEVYTWGGKGGLGHESGPTAKPTKIEGIDPVKQASCGEDFTILRTAKDQLISFGKNTYG